MDRIVLIVTGGSDLTDPAHWQRGLDALADAMGPDAAARVLEVHHGERAGWDRRARAWAIARGLPQHGMTAEDAATDTLKRAQWGKRRNWLFMTAAKRRAAELGATPVCLAGWNGSSDATANGIAVAVFLGIQVVPYRAWRA
ncbi:MAG: hypothetical protein ACI8PZ_001791 [Myxococcota bacterium]|jgi:hypothetical protein